MNRHSLRVGFLLFFMAFILLNFKASYAQSIRGIYLTQSSVEDTKLLNYFIQRAKRVGINTFVMDLERPSKRYRDNVALVKQNGILYVARIVMFPDGGTRELIHSKDYWEKRYKLVKQAIEWGANEIQLDYIRYKASQQASSQNSKDVLAVIQFFKNRVEAQNIPLQIDVFGITSYGESKHIGQNIVLFANAVNAICPMVYPSHYYPFKEHFNDPHGTVYESLARIKAMFPQGNTPFRLYAWIELSNYHYSMSTSHRMKYIDAQLNAVEKAKADGWFAWSANNLYDNLFNLLERRKPSAAEVGARTETETLPAPLQEAFESRSDASALLCPRTSDSIERA